MITTDGRKDFEIESDSEDDQFEDNQETYYEDEDVHLTAQEKKVKLAKKYLAAVEEEEKQKSDVKDEVDSHVLKKLKNEELEKAGRLRKNIADYVIFDVNRQNTLMCKHHKLSITCSVISSDSKFLYTASKDCSIIRWSLEEFNKTHFILFKSKQTTRNNQYHSSIVNCLAISSDNKYLISGDEEGIINIWEADSLKFVKSFEGHKSSVTDLAVCPFTNSLYSTSKDALVKVWNLNEFAYMETLFGHQAAITSVDVINSDRIITAGGTDKTLRVWKLQEESQLVYNGHSGNIDVVRKLDEGYFISGGDDGSICLWSSLKKKPLYTVHNAHGFSSLNSEANWISALAVFSNTDLIVSGSCDGYIRFWKWSQSSKIITPLSIIRIEGFVNTLRFSPNGKYLIVGIGREHRLGRWWNINKVKNCVLCIPFSVEIANK